MTKLNSFRNFITLGVIMFSLQTISGEENSTAFEKGYNSITEASLQAQIEFLSSDWFGGRETAMPGAYMAGDYIASQFKLFGASPLYKGDLNDGYFQNVKLISTSLNSASVSVTHIHSRNIGTTTFHSGTDLLAYNILKDLSITGEIFWGGYGLHSRDANQLAGAKKGQILLRAAGFPGKKDSTSIGWQLYSNLSDQQLSNKKNEEARKAGFSAVLEFSQDEASPVTIAHPNQDREVSERSLHKFTSGIYRKTVRLIPSEREDPIPVIRISHDILHQILPNWTDEIANIEMNAARWKGSSISNKTATINSITERELIECRNILSVIEGERSDEIIVIGAHYDHLGEYDGYLWNGADDNASGTVAVIALARAFAESGVKPKRTLVFAAWTAEERGLHGSTHFVNTHPDPSSIKYYLNYDMIGRDPNPENASMNTTFIYSEKNEEMATLTRKANTDLNLDLNIRFAPSALPASGSDNAPFALNGIPIMWYFAGMHDDYHGPYDQAFKLNYSKIAAIVKASYSVVWQLANE
jgi:hypothetical protein